jgi:hypothetical protein
MLKKLSILVLALLITACSKPAHSESAFAIPQNFYSNEIGQCKINRRNGNEITARTDSAEIQPIIGFDWQKHHTENSTSLRVAHDPLSRPIAFLSAVTHKAAAEKNPEDIKISVEFIYQIAASNQFMNTVTRKEALATQCYAGGDTSAPCPAHAPQHLAINMTTYLISAIWIREYLTSEQFKVIDNYVDRIYSKYIEPYATHDDRKVGYISEMANLGMGRLAYANWKNDTGMAEAEFKFRFDQINRAIEDSGYIKGNSYRGVRGIFYHSMGVDVTLAYIQLAKVWNYPVPPGVLEKAKKSAELINVYSRNPADFYNFPDSKVPFNASKNPKEAAGIHQLAISLGPLMKNVVGLEFLSEPRYERLRRREFIDVMLGFDPVCMFAQAK